VEHTIIYNFLHMERIRTNEEIIISVKEALTLIHAMNLSLHKIRGLSHVEHEYLHEKTRKLLDEINYLLNLAHPFHM